MCLPGTRGKRTARGKKQAPNEKHGGKRGSNQARGRSDPPSHPLRASCTYIISRTQSVLSLGEGRRRCLCDCREGRLLALYRDGCSEAGCWLCIHGRDECSDARLMLLLRCGRRCHSGYIVYIVHSKMQIRAPITLPSHHSSGCTSLSFSLRRPRTVVAVGSRRRLALTHPVEGFY